ncbi:DUF4422 domain-containing protein [Klebsiella pneumoniae]|nr:DUF4422 domain-containing protein [Klebsiella pneumoniae]
MIISLRIRFIAELTAHYWVWKNEELADHVGFAHHRRHLNSSEKTNFSEDTGGRTIHALTAVMSKIF